MQHPDAQHHPPQAQEPQDLAGIPDDVESDALFPLVSAPIDPEDDPDEIFLRAVSEIDTQPLPRSKEEEELAGKRFAIFSALLVVSFLAGSILGAVTYPTVTVTLVPVERDITLTLPMSVPLRLLAPARLSQSLSAPTTGRGHQDARAATGNLTFYNGEFSAQSIAAGTVFTGSDGIKVATAGAVTVPAANPPYLGQASVPARAVIAGTSGNIPALAINARCCFPDIVVNNSAPFTGGRDARDYQAVAQADLSGLTARLKSSLVLQLPLSFTLRTGEAAQPTRCAYRFSSDHQVGQEAQAVTATGVGTCQGLAYNAATASSKAIAAFTRRANPGRHFELLGMAQTTVVSVWPFLVRCHGTWVYHLTGDEELFLAAHIAGDNPQQAITYLLHTGFVRQAVVPENVPKDPDYIHFRVVVND